MLYTEHFQSKSASETEQITLENSAPVLAFSYNFTDASQARRWNHFCTVTKWNHVIGKQNGNKCEYSEEKLTTKIKSKRKMLNMKQEERIMKKNNSITHTHKRKKKTGNKNNEKIPAKRKS